MSESKDCKPCEMEEIIEKARDGDAFSVPQKCETCEKYHYGEFKTKPSCELCLYKAMCKTIQQGKDCEIPYEVNFCGNFIRRPYDGQKQNKPEPKPATPFRDAAGCHA